MIRLLWLSLWLLVTPAAGAGDDVLLTYEQIHPILMNTDEPPLLTVYESGRVVVHYPAYHKQSGTYETHLSNEALDRFVQSVLDHGFMSHDRSQIEATLQAKQHEKGTLHHIACATRDIVTYHGTAGSAAGTTGERLIGGQTLETQAVEQLAAEYPEVSALQDVATIQRSLDRLIDQATRR